MSELQQYYDHFCTGYWADPDPEKCGCRGTGWALSDVDTTHKCPIHYKGQLDPAFDDPIDLSENVDSRGPIDGGPDDADPNEPDIEELMALDPREAYREDEVPF